MDTKDLILAITAGVGFLGILATLGVGIANLVINLRTSKRTAFVNTVTSERIKWIGKVRENISKLLARWKERHYVRPAMPENLDLEIEQLKIEVRLQLNPIDPEDRKVEDLIQRLVTTDPPMTKEVFQSLQNDITVATQALLKREWDKVKDEAVEGDLRKRKK